MNALSNEYYRLYDLVEKAIDYISENDEELYEEDDNGGAADDYDIEPIKKTADEKTREELWGTVFSLLSCNAVQEFGAPTFLWYHRENTILLNRKSVNKRNEENE